MVRVHLALLLVNLIYGINYTVAKEVMPDYIQPFGFIVIRASVAWLLFAVFHGLFVKERIQKKDVPRLALCGVFGVAINQLLFFKGLDITTPINASLIMITTPVLVLLFSAFLIGERITLLKITGIASGASGAAVIILFGKDLHVGSDTFWGDLLIFVNATSYSIYLVIAKPLMVKYHPLTVIKWVFFFGILVVIPVGYGQFSEIEWNEFTPGIWASVVYVVVFTTFIAYILNIFALSKVNPSVVSIYIYLQPFIASAVALWFGKDELTPLKVAASLLIFTGIYLVSRRENVKKI